MSAEEKIESAPYDMGALVLPDLLDPQKDPTHALIMVLLKQLALLQIRVEAIESCFDDAIGDLSELPRREDFRDAFADILCNGETLLHSRNQLSVLEKEVQALLDGVKEVYRAKPFD